MREPPLRPALREELKALWDELVKESEKSLVASSSEIFEKRDVSSIDFLNTKVRTKTQLINMSLDEIIEKLEKLRDEKREGLWSHAQEKVRGKLNDSNPAALAFVNDNKSVLDEWVKIQDVMDNLKVAQKHEEKLKQTILVELNTLRKIPSIDLTKMKSLVENYGEKLPSDIEIRSFINALLNKDSRELKGMVGKNRLLTQLIAIGLNKENTASFDQDIKAKIITELKKLDDKELLDKLISLVQGYYVDDSKALPTLAEISKLVATANLMVDHKEALNDLRGKNNLLTQLVSAVARFELAKSAERRSNVRESHSDSDRDSDSESSPRNERRASYYESTSEEEKIDEEHLQRVAKNVRKILGGLSKPTAKQLTRLYEGLSSEVVNAEVNKMIQADIDKESPKPSKGLKGWVAVVKEKVGFYHDERVRFNDRASNIEVMDAKEYGGKTHPNYRAGK